MSVNKQVLQSDLDVAGFDLINVPRLGIGLPTDVLPTVQLQVRKSDANNTSLTDIAWLEHSTSGVAAAGIATGLVFRAENPAGSLASIGRVSSTLLVATAGHEYTSIDWWVVGDGSALTQVAVLTGGPIASGGTFLTLGDPAAAHPDAGIVLGFSYIQQEFSAGLDRLQIVGSDEISFHIGAVSHVLEGKVDNAGNWLLGTGSLATNVNSPFPCIPMMNGIPTGLPSSVIAGMAPIVIDYSDQRFYWYQNQGVVGWYYASAGAPGGTGAANEMTYWTDPTHISGVSTLTVDPVNARIGIGAGPASCEIDIDKTVNTSVMVSIHNRSAGANAIAQTYIQANVSSLQTLAFSSAAAGSTFQSANSVTQMSTGGAFWTGTLDAQSLSFFTNSTTRVTIDSNGNITNTQGAQTSGSPTAYTLIAGAHTTLAASTEAIDVNYNLARTVQFATGAIATQRAMVVRAPTYGFVGASVITTAATLAVTGAPVQGTNATITVPLAFWVQAGNTALAGNLVVGGSAGSYGGGTGVVSLLNASVAPSSDPTGGGILYASAGALLWRGSSGTITTIADA